MYCPASQKSQKERAVAFWNLPGAHAVQEDELASENLPLAQSWHTSLDCAPTCVEALPDAQPSHDAEAALLVYLPAPQSVQSPLPVPLKVPAEHALQNRSSFLPVSD